MTKIKKIAEVPITTDKVTSSSSSSSDEPSSILGKRSTTMESSPTATTRASFMESPLPGASKISPIQSLIKAGTSLGTSILNSIGGVFGANVDETKNLGDDLTDSTLRPSGGIKETLDDSGDNVRYLCIF
jgi:hypothetical protein